MALEIMQVLVASSSHVSKEEAQLFDEFNNIDDRLPESIGALLRWDYGWIFYIGGPNDCGDLTNLSPGLAGVIQLAWNEKLEWVRLDADGPVLENIPTYDW